MILIQLLTDGESVKVGHLRLQSAQRCRLDRDFIYLCISFNFYKQRPRVQASRAIVCPLLGESLTLAWPPRPEVKPLFKTSPLPRTMFSSSRAYRAGSQYTQEQSLLWGPCPHFCGEQSSCPAPSPLGKFCLDLTDNFLCRAQQWLALLWLKGESHFSARHLTRARSG